MTVKEADKEKLVMRQRKERRREKKINKELFLRYSARNRNKRKGRLKQRKKKTWRKTKEEDIFLKRERKVALI